MAMALQTAQAASLRPLIQAAAAAAASIGIGTRMLAHHAARSGGASSSTVRHLHSRSAVHRASPHNRQIYRSSLLCSSPTLPSSSAAAAARSFTSTSSRQSALTDLFAWHRAPYSPDLAALEPQLFAFVSQQLARQHGREDHAHTQSSPHAQHHIPAHHIHTAKQSSSAALTPTPTIKKGLGGGGALPPLTPPPSPPPSPPSSGPGDGSGSGGGGGDKKKSDVDPAHVASTYAGQAREITSTLLASLHLSSRTRLRSILLGLAGALGLAGLLIYVFRDPLKANLSEQTADVAKRSLTSSEVQLQVNVLSADVVQTLLANPAVLTQCQAFVGRLMALPETRQALVTLLAATAADPQALDVLSKFSAKLLAELMARPDTLSQLTALLRAAITAPGNELALQVLFKSFAADPKTQVMVAELARRAATDVLNDQAVRDTAKQALKDVTADASVQKSTGDAMWNAVKYSLKPHWLSGGTSTTPTTATTPLSAAAQQIEDQVLQEAVATPPESPPPPSYSEVATADAAAEAAKLQQPKQQQQQATTTTTTQTQAEVAAPAAEPIVTVQQTEDTRIAVRDIEPPVKPTASLPPSA